MAYIMMSLLRWVLVVCLTCGTISLTGCTGEPKLEIKNLPNTSRCKSELTHDGVRFVRAGTCDVALKGQVKNTGDEYAHDIVICAECSNCKGDPLRGCENISTEVHEITIAEVAPGQEKSFEMPAKVRFSESPDAGSSCEFSFESKVTSYKKGRR